MCIIDVMEVVNNIDFKILNFIYDNLHCTFLNKTMPIISKLGDIGIIFIVVAIVLICFKKYRKIGFTMLLSLIIGSILCNLIMKPLFARIRPYDINTAINLIINKLNDFSFPSGHTIAAFECATVIYLYNKKLSIPFIILAFLIAFSRLYLYVHYPSDIFASIILGIIVGYISFIIIKKIKKDK